jgi:hypothetical protein
MRGLIFGAILVVVASLGSYTLILSWLTAARDAKAASFSERFDAVHKPAV